MNRKIVLVGKSCSGKSVIAEQLKLIGLRPQLSTTTRPMRKYEKNGIDYNFVTEEQFIEMLKNDLFIESDNFAGWYYGLEKKEFENSDILILTPRGLQQILKVYDREKLLIIYIETSIKIRKERVLGRGDTHDSIYRRWVADDIDFENIENWGGPWDLKISIQTENSLKDLINILIKKI